MMPRYRLFAVSCFGLLVGCDGGDSLAPRTLAGTWISAGSQSGSTPDFPDTLVLDQRGGGRIAVRPFFEMPPQHREEWWTSGVRYRIRDDRVLLAWCAGPTGLADCAGGWHSAGRIAGDGTLQVTQISPRPSSEIRFWTRIAR